MQLFREFIRLIVEAQNPDYHYVDEDNPTGWMDRIRDTFGVEIGEYISAGVYGSVYKGTMSDGRPVAVKLSSDSREYIPYAKMAAVRDRLPEIVRRHFVEVIYAGPVKEIFNDTWSIVIMERLVKIPAEIKATLFGEKTGTVPVSQEKLLVDPEVVIKFVPRALRSIPKSHFAFSDSEITSVINGAIFRGKSNSPAGSWRNEYYSITSPRQNIWRLLAAIGDDLEKFLKPRQKPTSKAEVERYVSDFIYSMERSFSNIRIPGNYSKSPMLDRPGLTKIPGAGGLMRALVVLSKMVPDLQWGDIHSNNVMMRPSTGEIVVSDLGFFQNQNSVFQWDAV